MPVDIIQFDTVFLCFFVSQVTDKGSLTAEEFAKLLGLSVLLSKERYIAEILLLI